MKKKCLVLMVLCVLTIGLFAQGGKESAAPATAKADAPKPTLTFMTIKTTVDMSKEQPYSLYKGVTGYDIKWESLSGTEQLMLLLASGEKKDLITVTSDQFSTMLGEGAAMDITDLIDKYGPDIKKGIPTLFAATTINGRIMGIPSVKAALGFCKWNLIGREDLLDKAGLKQATDIESFYNNLVALKKAYPDMIPLGMDNEHENSHLVSNITSAFGFRGEWMENGDKIVPYIKNPGLKPYVEFMTKLYKEGLLDADFPALTRRDKFTKFSANKTVMMDDSWDGCRGYVQTLHEDFPDSVVEPFSFLADQKGVRHVEIPKGADYFAVIPVNSEHAIDTIKAYNEIIKPENQVYLAIGEEGVHWKYDENQNYIPIQPKFNDDKINAHLFFAAFRNEVYYNKIWQARLMKNPDMYRIAVHIRALTKQCEDEAYSPVVLAPSVTVIDNYASIQSYLKDGIVQIITGKKPISYVDELVKYWDANGGNKVEQFYNDWYKTNKK